MTGGELVMVVTALQALPMQMASLTLFGTPAGTPLPIRQTRPHERALNPCGVTNEGHTGEGE